MIRALRARSRDVTAGLLFAFAGAAALVVGSRYERGTTQSMGSGYVPMLAGWLLCALGVLIAARAGPTRGSDVVSSVPPLAVTRRPFAVIVAVAAFALLLERAGLVVATPALVGIASLGDRDLTLTEVAALAAVLTGVATVVFAWGLGIPLKVLPGP